MLIPCLCLWMIRCFSSCVIHGVQCLLLVVAMVVVAEIMAMAVAETDIDLYGVFKRTVPAGQVRQ